jgi:dihydroorotate dehydrogenase
MVDLAVSLGRLRFRNPVLVASGTFGYAREMEGVVDFAQLGGIVPKTVTASPRVGKYPRPRVRCRNRRPLDGKYRSMWPSPVRQ